jgi:hypothetical protein
MGGFLKYGHRRVYMSIEITWVIDSMKSTTSTGEVCEVFWSVWALRGTCQASIDGKTTLVPNSDSENFISFQDLTENQVLLWVKNIVTPSVVEQSVLDRLNTLHPPPDEEPTITYSIPWGGS